MKIQSIDIDFAVWQHLTGLLMDGNDSYNQVLKRLLGKKANNTLHFDNSSCVVKGVEFPAGTELFMKHKGRTYQAKIEQGKFKLEDGRTFTSPSSAASAITGTSVNGWKVWSCRLPGYSDLKVLTVMRDEWKALST